VRVFFFPRNNISSSSSKKSRDLFDIVDKTSDVSPDDDVSISDFDDSDDNLKFSYQNCFPKKHCLHLDLVCSHYFVLCLLYSRIQMCFYFLKCHFDSLV